MTKVYVLGAGASAAYTGSFLGETSPVAKNFFQKAMRVMNIHQVKNRYFGDENLKYRHIFAFIEEFWGISKDKIARSDLDMEEVLTLLNIELQEDTAGQGRLVQAYEEFLLLMALTFDKILYGTPCPHYQRIAESLQPEDTVISFNYELLMDYALLNRKDARVFWHTRDGYGIPCNNLQPSAREKEQGELWRHEATGPAQPSSNIQLLKLHGSLNWLYCPRCGRLFTYQHDGVAGQSLIINGMANMLNCMTRNCCQRLSRVIIPPTLMKNYQSVPFIPKLWGQARRALEKASEIIIIGYSFPPTDFRSNWMFRKAMTRNQNLKRVVVIDTAEGYPLKTLLTKHKSIFRVNDIAFYPNLAEYSPRITPQAVQ
ncbi:hypothetical protein [Desulforamulus ruminis]|nr:hypothetical protein [Desulforamulus ruminis]